MLFPRPYTLSEIADLLSCTFVGDPAHVVMGLNEIHRVSKGDLVFVDHPKYYNKALESDATTILIDTEVDCPVGKGLIVSQQPFADFVKLGQHFAPFLQSHDLVSTEAQIGKTSIVQPGAFVGPEVTIGENCIIHSNVSLNNKIVIGDNVIIHSGTVIGSDGFYYKNLDQGFLKLQSVGSVEIEDSVEIGANCTIDRGVTAATKIGKGTKIDNLVQVGHDTIIGEKCLIAAQVGIAGCTVLKNNVTLWGQVGVISGIVIEDNVRVLAQSGVSKSLNANTTYFGSPAEEAKKQIKRMVKLNRLTD